MYKIKVFLGISKPQDDELFDDIEVEDTDKVYDLMFDGFFEVFYGRIIK